MANRSAPVLIPNYYIPPFGLPLRWQDEQSGRLVAAVTAYFERKLTNEQTNEQIALVADYCRYYASAPCWEDPQGAIAALAERAPLLKSMTDIDDWLEAALHEAIDPF